MKLLLTIWKSLKIMIAMLLLFSLVRIVEMLFHWQGLLVLMFLMIFFINAGQSYASNRKNKEPKKSMFQIRLEQLKKEREK